MKRSTFLFIIIILTCTVHAQEMKSKKAPKERDFTSITDSLDKLDNSFYLLIEMKSNWKGLVKSSKDLDTAGVKYISYQEESALSLIKFKNNKIIYHKVISCPTLTELLVHFDKYDIITLYLDFKADNDLAARFIYLGGKAGKIRETYKEVANENVIDSSTSDPEEKAKAEKILNSLACIVSAEQ